MANTNPNLSTRFQPGNKGGGRPKEDAEFKMLAKARSADAFELLEKFMDDDKCDKKLRVTCAIYIIERAHGKPIQEVKGIQGNKYTEMWLSAARRADRIGTDGKIRPKNKGKSAT